MIVHDEAINEPVPIKRGRGRPKGSNKLQSIKGSKLKKKRGRPKKYFYPEDLDQDSKTSITGEREVVKCCALSCTNTSASFVMCKLPSDRKMRFQWIRKIGRSGWNPAVDAALCQIHFEPDMWIHEPKLRLKASAVPTMFLEGENIKSWVTMDHSGNVRNLVVGASVRNGSAGSDEEGEDEMDIEGVSIKSEVLEPEIDMVVGGGEVDPFSVEFNHTKSKFDGDCLSSGLAIKSVFSQDAECILPDVYSPASPDLGVHMLADRVKVFTCPLCAKNLARRRSLVLHMQRIHPGAEETKQIMEDRARMHRRRKKVLKTEAKHIPIKTTPSPSPVESPETVSEARDPLSTKPVTNLVGTSPLPQPSAPDASKVKPFFLLIPANFQPSTLPPLLPSTAPSSLAVPPPLANSAWDSSDMFCVTLKPLPLDTRTALKRKLMELVEAVTVRNIPPQKIIIAYSNSKDEEKPSTSASECDSPPVIDVS